MALSGVGPFCETSTISADGGLVLFGRSDTSPVTADDRASTSFVREVASGTTRPVPAASAGTGPLSADGRFTVRFVRPGCLLGVTSGLVRRGDPAASGTAPRAGPQAVQGRLHAALVVGISVAILLPPSGGRPRHLRDEPGTRPTWPAPRADGPVSRRS